MDAADLDCVADPGREGVALVSHPLTDHDAPTWYLYCADCVARFRRLNDPATRYIHIAGVVTTSKGEQP